MSGGRIRISVAMAARDLARNRVAVALLAIIPLVLFAIVYVTTGDRPIPIELSAAGTGVREESERALSLLFIALTSISGVSAFLAFALVLRPIAADRRLVFEGFRPSELLLSKVIVMTAVAALVALYVALLLPLLEQPSRPLGVLAGFLLASLVYAALGMALGAVVRRELEGLLTILVLVNIDAGWLQNPAFYAHAHQQQLIRMLPAHHPGQVVMLSAFTSSGLGRSIGVSLAYCLALLFIAGLTYWLRVRVEH